MAPRYKPFPDPSLSPPRKTNTTISRSDWTPLLEREVDYSPPPRHMQSRRIEQNLPPTPSSSPGPWFENPVSIDRASIDPNENTSHFFDVHGEMTRRSKRLDSAFGLESGYSLNQRVPSSLSNHRIYPPVRPSTPSWSQSSDQTSCMPSYGNPHTPPSLYHSNEDTDEEFDSEDIQSRPLTPELPLRVDLSLPPTASFASSRSRSPTITLTPNLSFSSDSTTSTAPSPPSSLKKSSHRKVTCTPPSPRTPRARTPVRLYQPPPMPPPNHALPALPLSRWITPENSFLRTPTPLSIPTQSPRLVLKMSISPPEGPIGRPTAPKLYSFNKSANRLTPDSIPISSPLPSPLTANQESYLYEKTGDLFPAFISPRPSPCPIPIPFEPEPTPPPAPTITPKIISNSGEKSGWYPDSDGDGNVTRRVLSKPNLRRPGLKRSRSRSGTTNATRAEQDRSSAGAHSASTTIPTMTGIGQMRESQASRSTHPSTTTVSRRAVRRGVARRVWDWMKGFSCGGGEKSGRNKGGKGTLRRRG